MFLILYSVCVSVSSTSDVQLHYRACSEGKERVCGQATAATAERSGETQQEQQTQEEMLLTD